LTKVLSGVISGWEGYMSSELDIVPKPTLESTALVRNLFPAVPFHHPVNDWW
jgi:hypothetical protein